MDFNKLNQHTRLWRWMVYSRATTSAMALRWVLPEAFLVEDISADSVSSGSMGREVRVVAQTRIATVATATTPLAMYVLTEFGCGLVEG